MANFKMPSEIIVWASPCEIYLKFTPEIYPPEIYRENRSQRRDFVLSITLLSFITVRILLTYLIYTKYIF